MCRCCFEARLDQIEGQGREDRKNGGDMHLLVSVEVKLNDFVDCLQILELENKGY